MNLIKIELQVTPEQLLAIATALTDKPTVKFVTPGPPVAPDDEMEAFENADPVTGEIDLVEAGKKELAASLFITDPKPVVPDPIPTPPVAPPVAPPAPVEVELDSKGIPHDLRIHGKAKTKNANGSWRLKQGIDRVTFLPQVEAELRAAVGTTPAPTAAEVIASGAPIIPAPTHPQTIPTTFSELIPLVLHAKTNGLLTDEAINTACKQLGLAQFGLIATRPDLIPQMVELLGV